MWRPSGDQDGLKSSAGRGERVRYLIRFAHRATVRQVVDMVATREPRAGPSGALVSKTTRLRLGPFLAGETTGRSALSDQGVSCRGCVPLRRSRKIAVWPSRRPWKTI